MLLLKKKFKFIQEGSGRDPSRIHVLDIKLKISTKCCNFPLSRLSRGGSRLRLRSRRSRGRRRSWWPQWGSPQRPRASRSKLSPREWGECSEACDNKHLWSVTRKLCEIKFFNQISWDKKLILPPDLTLAAQTLFIKAQMVWTMVWTVTSFPRLSTVWWLMMHFPLDDAQWAQSVCSVFVQQSPEQRWSTLSSQLLGAWAVETRNSN